MHEKLLGYHISREIRAFEKPLGVTFWTSVTSLCCPFNSFFSKTGHQYQYKVISEHMITIFLL
jgi:hypothetical protein